MLATEVIFKCSCIVFLSSFPFLFSLDGDFVFDDTEAVVKNKDVLSESWSDCFYNDFWGTNIKSNLSHKSYRPLTILSFRLNYIIDHKQLSAFSFKFTNLICHILCSILVWYTYRILTAGLINKKYQSSIDISFFGAALFAVHPVHTEAVAGIVGRADLLCGVTFFLSFLMYCKAMAGLKYMYIYLFFSILLSAFSMLCKENGVTVLGFCIVYDIVNNIKIKKNKSLKVCDPKLFMTRLFILLLSTLFLLYGRWIVMGATKPVFKSTDNPAAFVNDSFTKVATYNYIYFLNAVLCIWPQWLCYDWSMGCVPLIQSIFDYRILSIVVIYVYVGLFFYSLENRRNKSCSKRFLIMSVALILLPFLPAANIFYAVGFVVAERILYVPSAGYCLLVSFGLNKIIQRCKKHTVSVLSIILFLILILSYGLRSWQRSKDWKNEYLLFTKALEVCPLNAKVHYNIAKVADASNDTEWALFAYKESIRLYPEYYQAMNNLANMLKNQKKYSEAEFYLKNAIKYKQDFPAAWMNLGIVLASTKQMKASEKAYKTALLYRKNYPDCYYNLGNLYLELNRTNDAIESWTKAVSLNRKHVLAWTNLLALLDNTEQINKALEIIPKVIKEVPDAPSINFALGNIYGKIDRFTEAEQYFLRAIKLFDNKVQAIHYANLGVLYHRWKKYRLAETMYKNALQLNPNFNSAKINLISLQKFIK